MTLKNYLFQVSNERLFSGLMRKNLNFDIMSLYVFRKSGLRAKLVIYHASVILFTIKKSDVK